MVCVSEDRPVHENILSSHNRLFISIDYNCPNTLPGRGSLISGLELVWLVNLL
jgi:hypothetical protein